MQDDRDEYRFFSRSDALVEVRMHDRTTGPELAISGNRSGLLALANVLLWFVANAWRREFLSLGELPFIRLSGITHLVLRLSAHKPDGQDGEIKAVDTDGQFEWEIAEEDLQRVALMIHRTVADPSHEYDRLRVREGSAAGVEIRLSDAPAWL